MSYISTKIHIGMDVSEKSIELFKISATGNEQSAKILNSPESIKNLLNSMPDPSQVIIAMETGTHSPWMNAMIEKRGCKVFVGNARKLRAIWGDDKKCDERDAEMLARIARFDPKLLHSIKHVEQTIRAEQAVLKARDILVGTATTLTNHIRGTLRSFGISTAGLTADALPNKIMEILPNDLKYALDELVEELQMIKNKIKNYDKKLQDMCKKHPETKILQQITGVGPITALTFALIIANPKRFANGGRLGSFIGLVPRRDQSGAVDKQLGITKAGNTMLRKYLVQAANYIMGPFGKDCDLRHYGERIAAKGGKISRRKAKIAVARKLAIVMWRLWLNDAEYEPLHKLQKKQKRKANHLAA